MADGYVYSGQASLARHQTRCTVCRHPDKEQIEAAYLSWTPMRRIAQMFDLPDSSLNRHVQALGLAKQLTSGIKDAALNLVAVCTRQIEAGDDIKDPAKVMLSALNLVAKIDGQMVERKIDLTETIRDKTDEEAEFFLANNRWPNGPDELAKWKFDDGPDEGKTM